MASLSQFSVDAFREPPEEFALVADCAEPSVQVCMAFEAKPEHDFVGQWKKISSEAHLRGELTARRGIHSAPPRTWSLAQAKCFVDRLHCNGVTPVLAADLAGMHPHFDLLSTYAARLNYAMAQGKHGAQVALLAPCAPRAEEENVSKITGRYFDMLGAGLMGEHLDYDVVDDASIAGATSVDQCLLIAHEAFEVLVMPPSATIGVEAARKIAEFVEDGGKVIATAFLPVRDASGDAHDEVIDIFHKLFDRNPVLILSDFIRGTGPRLFSVQPGTEGAFFVEAREPAQLLQTVRAFVSKAIRPVVSARWHGRECVDLQCVRRTMGREELLLFANTSPEPREVQLMIRCAEAPDMLNPETGGAVCLPNCTQRGSRTVLLHRFEGYSSLLVYFTTEPSLTATWPPTEGLETHIGGEWQFGSGENGHAIFRKQVHIPSLVSGQRVVLRAVAPTDAVEVAINGSEAGVRGWAPFDIDVTQLVHPGSNLVEMRICRPHTDLAEPDALLDGARMLIC